MELDIPRVFPECLAVAGGQLSCLHVDEVDLTKPVLICLRRYLLEISESIAGVASEAKQYQNYAREAKEDCSSGV